MVRFEVLRDGERVELSVTGVVDARAAEELLELLDELEAEEVILDFTHCDRLQDVLFGALAEALDGRERLQLRGLGEHHLRVLHYLKLTVDERGQLRSIEESDQLSPLPP